MSVLDRLEALLAQEQPPWKPLLPGFQAVRDSNDESVCSAWGRDEEDGGRRAALICEAVNALPALIACARAAADLRARIEPEDDAAWGDIAALERLDTALARLAEGQES